MVVILTRVCNEYRTSICTPLLLQTGEIRLGLSQDWNICVGVFPQGEKVQVCRFGPVLVSRHCIGSSKLQVRKRTDGIVHDYATVV